MTRPTAAVPSSRDTRGGSSSSTRTLARAFSLAWLLWLAWCACGCLASPAPDPPDLDPPDVPRLIVDGPVGVPGPIRVHILGGEGSVAPGTTVWGAGWFVSDTPSTAIAGADGRFDLELRVDSARSQARLEVRLGDQRSEPIDVETFPREAPPVLLMEEPCFSIERTLDFGPTLERAVRTIGLVNLCSTDVTVTAATLRMPTASLEVQSPLPIVAPGTEGTIAIAFTPGASVDELLLVELEGGVAETRAVTITGR